MMMALPVKAFGGFPQKRGNNNTGKTLHNGEEKEEEEEEATKGKSSRSIL
jgi:hypothetical protein